MTVFITIPWFSPAFRAGGPIQSIYNLVQNFDENISYKIFCGNTDLNGEILTGIDFDVWTNFNSCTQVWYSASNNQSKDILQQIKIIAPNVLFIVGIFSWRYNIVPLLKVKAKNKILSVRGMLHPGALSQKAFKKMVFLTFLKILGIHKKVSFHATDENEKVFIENIFGKKSTVFVANNFSKKMNVAPPLLTQINYLKLITIALISPMKNHLLVLQSLLHCTVNIEYNIYGPIKDETYWQQCKEVIKTMPKNILVNYYGEIEPASLEKELEKNHVFIMPSKSENYGHSLIEALAAGKPIITSNNTTWNNLEENNAGINVDTNENSITNAINYFAEMNDEKYKTFCACALEYANKKVNIDAIKVQYQRMFFSV